MAECHRLGALEMREAGHHRVGVGLSLRCERRLQRSEARVDVVDRVAHEEAKVGRHLVVARARGVEPAGRLADDLLQPRLDIHVNVLERARKGELTGGDL